MTELGDILRPVRNRAACTTWQSLAALGLQPNAAPPVAFVIERADFSRFDSHYSGLYFGASIIALQHLAERKAYRFVGTNANWYQRVFRSGGSC